MHVNSAWSIGRATCIKNHSTPTQKAGRSSDWQTTRPSWNKLPISTYKPRSTATRTKKSILFLILRNAHHKLPIHHDQTRQTCSTGNQYYFHINPLKNKTLISSYHYFSDWRRGKIPKLAADWNLNPSIIALVIAKRLFVINITFKDAHFLSLE